MRKRYLRPIPFRRGFGVRTRLRPANFARYKEEEASTEGKTNEEILVDKCRIINERFFGEDTEAYQSPEMLMGFVEGLLKDDKLADDGNAVMACDQLIRVLEYLTGKTQEKPRWLAVYDPAEVVAPYVKKEEKPEQKVEATPPEQPPKPAETVENKFWTSGEDYSRPAYGILNKSSNKNPQDEEATKAKGEKIVAKLNEFKVPAEIADIKVGPTVTRYELKLGSGIKVDRVLKLENDLALALNSNATRISIVPENGTVGIEVANEKSRSVPISEVFKTEGWREAQSKMAIPAVLGEDITGKPIFADIGKMPHGLIAGTTGSGKSVCLNGIITSILYSASPDEVKFVMVDPKAVELKPYNDVPHMIAPVISNMDKAFGMLKWLTLEMEDRYKQLEKAKVKNIGEYNKKMGESYGKQKMPRIVCIIDEFGDLMDTHGEEVELEVQRLTQLARAAGIHILLATQRPDAKTVTGKIKANISTRIALRTESGVNSRIILDENGAERLVGKGDMLYKKPGEEAPLRVQGVWVSEDEIDKIVADVVKKNGKPKYKEDVISTIDKYSSGIDGNGNEAEKEKKEKILKDAFELLAENPRQATIAFLRAMLKTKHENAVKIMRALEHRGYVGPFEGQGKPRKILRETWEEPKKRKANK